MPDELRLSFGSPSVFRAFRRQSSQAELIEPALDADIKFVPEVGELRSPWRPGRGFRPIIVRLATVAGVLAGIWWVLSAPLTPPPCPTASGCLAESLRASLLPALLKLFGLSLAGMLCGLALARLLKRVSER